MSTLDCSLNSTKKFGDMDKNGLTLNRHIPDLVHSWHCLSYTVSKAGSLSVLLSLVTETK